MNIRIDRDEVIQILGDLVSINSVNPEYMADGPGEAGVAEYIERFFRKNNIAYEFQDVFPDRANIIGTIPGKKDDRHLAFESHMDVVSVKGMTIEPFSPKIKGNRLYGRGSCDTKATMTGMLCAIKAILKSGGQPLSTVSIIGAVDEEAGQGGVKKLVASNPDYTAAVIGEPTELKVVRAHKGCIRWKIAVEGKAAHTSKPGLGINAIVKMSGAIDRIEKSMQPILKAKSHSLVGNPTLTISMIEGGTQVNFVPDECKITLDRRIIPGEDKETVWAEFEPVLSRMRTDDPALKIVMEEPFTMSWAMETPENAEIIQVGVKASHEVLKRAEIAGVPYGTDASPLVRMGIPCLVLGPGSIDQAHTADEWVDIDEVVKCASMYASIMMNY